MLKFELKFEWEALSKRTGEQTLYVEGGIIQHYVYYVNRKRNGKLYVTAEYSHSNRPVKLPHNEHSTEAEAKAYAEGHAQKREEVNKEIKSEFIGF